MKTSTVLEVKTVVETKQAEKNVEDLSEKINDGNEATKGMTDSLDKMTGGAITAFKGIVSGAKNGVKAFTTLKGAIAATGIGLLVVAVGSLVSYFTSTQKGADMLNKAFAGIGATIDVLVDRLSTFGGGLMEIFSGNFSAGLDILAGSFKGITAEIKEEASAAIELETASQKLLKTKRAFIEQEAKLNADLEKYRLASENFDLSTAERLAANTKAQETAIELANQQMAIAQEELRILSEKNALGESMNEDLDAEAEAKARLFEIERSRDALAKEFQAKAKGITDEQKAKAEAARAEAEAKAKEANDALIAEAEAELERIEEQNAKEIALSEKKAAEQKAIDDQLAADKLAAKEKLAAAELAVEQTKQQAINDGAAAGFALLGSMAKKGSKEAKGIAVAQVMFDTIRGIQSTFATASANVAGTTATMGAWPFIQAASAAAFGAVNIKKILSTPDAGSGGGSVSSPSYGGGMRPSTSTPRIPNFNAENLGVGGGNTFDRPLRAVVINQDIKDNDQLDSKVNDLISIGK